MSIFRNSGVKSSRLAIACAAVLTTWLPRASAQTTTYTATWASVDSHVASPEWFQDAKFGIYYHWGAFATPAFGNEWYPRNMFNKSGNSSEYQHHLSTYGDPFGTWGFDKFLTGANDKSGKFVQFAPKLVANGGAWDPDAWAQMFLDAGAWFVGPVAEHHDGFSMWDSKSNPWNSVLTGPKLDLAKIQVDIYRKKGFKVVMTMHHQWHFDPTGYYQWAPVPADDKLKQLYGKLPTAQEEQIWSDKLKEIIDQYMPDLIWQDNYLGRIPEARRLEFLAYYYNAGIKAGREVVATAKEGITPPSHKGQVLDYERGGPADISTPYWLTDDAVSPSSWCYVNGMGYYTDAQEIGAFIDKVSKGGNLLLNVSPMADGTFPQRQKDILAAFGKFLKQMGTAIYNTRPWLVYGEGPTTMGGGSFTGPKALTSSDIRYTKSKDGDAVYAILGGWPGNGKVVNMTAVTTSRFAVGSGKVFLFGPVGGAATSLTFTQDTSGLHVTLPSTQPYTALAYAIKISKGGIEPAAAPCLNNAPCSGTGGTGGTGGASTGGSSSTGGTMTAGGRNTGGAAIATGGTGVSAGGSKASGGATTAGGVSATGGTTTVVATGGASVTGTGGNVAMGGSMTTGGGTATSTGGAASLTGGQSVGGQLGIGGSGVVGGAATIGGTVGTAVNDTSDGAGGCGCRAAGERPKASGIAALGALGLLLMRSRRRRARECMR